MVLFFDYLDGSRSDARCYCFDISAARIAIDCCDLWLVKLIAIVT